MGDTTDTSQTPDTTPPPSGGTGPLAAIDAWMARSPWHPRIVPMFTYLVLLTGTMFLWDPTPIGYVIAYVIMCVTTAWVALRYRHLMPEFNFKFHWLAVPVGIFVAVAWIGMAMGMIALFPEMFDKPGDDFFEHMGEPVAWMALGFRLLGMSIVVPIAEELMFRSLLLRAMARPKRVWIGLLNFLADMPGIGDMILNTKTGRRAAKFDGVFNHEFRINVFGTVTVCGVVISTAVFMLNHALRDWPAIWVCGVAYCLLVYWTRKKGLGPVIWAHGITNALLWGYTITMHLAGTPDWRFL